MYKLGQVHISNYSQENRKIQQLLTKHGAYKNVKKFTGFKNCVHLSMTDYLSNRTASYQDVTLNDTVTDCNFFSSKQLLHSSYNKQVHVMPSNHKQANNKSN